MMTTALTIPTLIRPLWGHLPYPFCPFGTFPLDKGNRPPGRGKALSVLMQGLMALWCSPHPALRATFPQGKAFLGP